MKELTNKISVSPVHMAVTVATTTVKGVITGQASIGGKAGTKEADQSDLATQCKIGLNEMAGLQSEAVLGLAITDMTAVTTMIVTVKVKIRGAVAHQAKLGAVAPQAVALQARLGTAASTSLVFRSQRLQMSAQT